MLQNLYDAKPFTTYWYYLKVHDEICDECGYEVAHALMRYRTYLGMKFPIIPTGTHYYLVCPECGKHQRIEEESTLMKLLSKSKGILPVKYNKYSQLDLEGYIEDEFMVLGTEKEFAQNIKLHIEDMRKREKSS